MDIVPIKVFESLNLLLLSGAVYLLAATLLLLPTLPPAYNLSLRGAINIVCNAFLYLLIAFVFGVVVYLLYAFGTPISEMTISSMVAIKTTIRYIYESSHSMHGLVRQFAESAFSSVSALE